jgi:hypothetical protein
MFAPYRFESGALRRKTSAGFASGQGFFLGITLPWPPMKAQPCGQGNQSISGVKPTEPKKLRLIGRLTGQSLRFVIRDLDPSRLSGSCREANLTDCLFLTKGVANDVSE